ncbi:hypothetical protein SKAU_G00106520 [Synaphobranchus kaupii]|uniref:Tumor protein p53-inducible nuclear protein 2 n=1 Tax=Synaphobranchus kaupii TaxID=118154 RepID=A0A9Q1J7M6_SYNKA|nr:hypothetical protein SKAU_G00106520 [Synaphobranchus kaupii]
MFQRLSSLIFGEVEDASTDLKGPKPCVSEAEEEGWLLVNLPGEDDWVESVEGRAETPAPPCSLAHNDCQGVEPCRPSQTEAPPPPCNHCRTKVEGATAETSPMEDLLIEHPSMSVYVSPSNLSIVEESTASLAVSVSMATDPAPPAMQSSAPRRVTRGAASQTGPLAKVTQMPRVQRAKARSDRRHLSRNRVQRQNRVREQAPPPRRPRPRLLPASAVPA